MWAHLQCSYEIHNEVMYHAVTEVAQLHHHLESSLEDFHSPWLGTTWIPGEFGIIRAHLLTCHSYLMLQHLRYSRGKVSSCKECGPGLVVGDTVTFHRSYHRYPKKGLPRPGRHRMAAQDNETKNEWYRKLGPAQQMATR